MSVRETEAFTPIADFIGDVVVGLIVWLEGVRALAGSLPLNQVPLGPPGDHPGRSSERRPCSSMPWT